MTREEARQRHLWLKYQLTLVGSSFAELSRELAVSYSAITMVAAGKSRSSRIEAAIAEAIGQEPEEIWPEYYEDEKMI